MPDNDCSPVSEPVPAQRPVFLQPCTGAVRQADGRFLLRMKAEKGAEVTVSVGNDFHTASLYPLSDEEGNGIYSVLLSFPDLRGPQKLVFRVNGQETLNPFAPLWFHANALSNYIELPDPETDELICADPKIPHGQISYVYYPSSVYGSFRSSLIYTPPSYDPSKKYPVLYFFHEVAENMTAWTDAPRIHFLLDNLIASGKSIPFIMVENDCTVRLDYHDREDWFEGYPQLEQFLLTECIPYVEKHFGAAEGKWNRAIAGIGLGAVQAGYLGVRNTDIFGSLGLFTAFWPSASFHKEGKEDPFYDGLARIGEDPEVLDVFFRSEGDQDMHFKGILEEDEMIRSLGADRVASYVTRIYHESHTWGSYRRSFRDFAPLLFRRNCQ